MLVTKPMSLAKSIAVCPEQMPPNKGLLTDAWVRCAPPRAAEAQVVRRASAVPLPIADQPEGA